MARATSVPLRRLPPAAARAPRRRGLGGTLVGVFIGLALGLGLAAAVAFYVMRAGNPYQSSVAGNAREPGREPAKSSRTDATPADKPRFDFYKILPGIEEPKVAPERKGAERGDRAVVEQAKEKTADKAAPAVADKDATRVPERLASAEPPGKAIKPGERFWLQAGSFGAVGDAENLKARLALDGWEAVVQEGNLPDKGVRYRVRLGPYDNTDELNRMKTELAKRGFEVAVIKY
jgi:cell division protein FtsN